MKPTLRHGILTPQLPRTLSADALTTLSDQVEFTAIALNRCDFSGHSGRGLIVEQVRGQGVVFQRTRLPHSRLVDVRFEGCDFSAADWEKTRWRRVEIARSRGLGWQLLEADLENVALIDCNLENCVLAASRLKNVRFEKCNLRGAVVEHAELTSAVFVECDLTRADWRGVKLDAVDVRGSIIDGLQAGAVDLRGAIIDRVQAAQIATLFGLIVKERDDLPSD